MLTSVDAQCYCPERTGQKSGFVFGHQGGVSLAMVGGFWRAYGPWRKPWEKQGPSTYDGLYCRSVTVRQA